MIDKEQLIEDLHFLSDQGNYKSIKYAIECIDKLEQIEQIIKSRDGFYLYDNLPPFQQIKEILEQE